MQRQEHRLLQNSPGTTRTLVSCQFGTPNQGPKAYIQAGLHADEAPGFLVARRLLQLLAAAESRGEITGEVIVVPVANPIGLSQWSVDTVQGRFDRVDNTNFNRHHLDFFEQVSKTLAGKLTSSPADNVALVRSALSEALAGYQPQTEGQHLRQVLLQLSHDADLMLDLHCDYEAVLHVYTGASLWPAARDLSAQLGAPVTLLADDSGGNPFDEANSKIWWQLAAKFPDSPIPPACLAATVELRGLADTSPAQTEADAAALLAFLQRRGVVAGDPGPLPTLPGEATPLAGVDYIKSQAAGILTYLKEVGDRVVAGEAVARLVNPLLPVAEEGVPICATTSGLLFARSADRFARPGKIVAKVAGAKTLADKGSHLLTI